MSAIDNYQFNYVFIGNKDKPIVLLLHGFIGSCEDFREIANLLEENFCCLLIDLPGHGKTQVSYDACYQMSELAQATIELLTELSIEQCFLVGYSMGGRLALYLTLKFPRYFTKVALESVSPGLETNAAKNSRIQQDLKLIHNLETEDFAAFLEQWYNNPLFTSFKQHSNYSKAIARRLNNDPSKLAKSLQYMGLGAQPSLWKELQNNRIPLLLIVGECDRKFIAINQKIVDLAPNSSLEIVENTGHNVHFEHPSILGQLLIKFFKI